MDYIICALTHKFPRCNQYLSSNASSKLPRELALALNENVLGLWVRCLHQSSENLDDSFSWLYDSSVPLDPRTHHTTIQLFLHAVLTIVEDPNILRRILLDLTERLTSLPNWMQDLVSLNKAELYNLILHPPYINSEDRMKVLLTFMKPEPNTDNIVNIAANVLQYYAVPEIEAALRAMTSSMPQSTLNEGLASLIASTGTPMVNELVRGIGMIIKLGANPNYQQKGCSMLSIARTHTGYFGSEKVIDCLQKNGAW